MHNHNRRLHSLLYCSKNGEPDGADNTCPALTYNELLRSIVMAFAHISRCFGACPARFRASPISTILTEAVSRAPGNGEVA